MQNDAFPLRLQAVGRPSAAVFVSHHINSSAERKSVPKNETPDDDPSFSYFGKPAAGRFTVLPIFARAGRG